MILHVQMISRLTNLLIFIITTLLENQDLLQFNFFSPRRDLKNDNIYIAKLLMLYED
jgi:hypothetical protein